MHRDFPVTQKLASKLTDGGQRLTKSEDNGPPVGLESTLPG